MSEIFFSIVVLNWNTLALLKKNLESLGAQTERALEVIIVDNGSTDGSVEWLATDEPQKLLGELPLLVEKKEKNLGFAAGMNAGLRLAKGRWLMPLNVDVFLAPDFFTLAKENLEKLKAPAALGPLVYRYSKEGPTEEVLCTYMELTRLLSLTTPLELPHLGKKVFGPAGCAPLFSRKALELAAIPSELSASGLLEYYDERYFAYGEDSDLYLRFLNLNLFSFYVPSLRCWHVHSGSQAGIRWHEKDTKTLARLPANAIDTCLKNLRGFNFFSTLFLLFLAPLAMSLILIWRAPKKFWAPLGAYFLAASRFERSLDLREYYLNLTNKIEE